MNRRLYATSAALITLGVLVALVGVLTHSFHTWRLGVLLAVAAMPALGYALIHRAAQATEEQLAHSHRAGYNLALDHVSQGLLDAPAPPGGGEGAGQYDPHGTNALCDDDLLGNVRPIRPHDGKDTNNRKAV
ncbi:hypothetical protein [Streptomyces sp. NPDC094032]|uniref:hypothetical protein n=1 Tax=Streptomyces sp. NPDC094032 TaxID=3155308 RepID=UPI00332B45B5